MCSRILSNFIMLPLLILSSCATIVNSPRQTIGICSFPSDADVIIDNYCVGRTPVQVLLTRKDPHTIYISLDGYQPYQIVLIPQLSAWVIGNLVCGGIIGVAIDAMTGSMYYLSPDQIYAQFAPMDPNFVPQQDHAYVSVVMKPDQNWQQIGQLTPR